MGESLYHCAAQRRADRNPATLRAASVPGALRRSIAARLLSILDVKRAPFGLHLVPSDGTARRWDDSATGMDACQGEPRQKFTGNSCSRPWLLYRRRGAAEVNPRVEAACGSR